MKNEDKVRVTKITVDYSDDTKQIAEIAGETVHCENFRAPLVLMNAGEMSLLDFASELHQDLLTGVPVSAYPPGWTIESTGGNCQWLRKGQIAITDGEAGLPVKGKSCVVVTLDTNGDYSDLIPLINFPSLEAAFAMLNAAAYQREAQHFFDTVICDCCQEERKDRACMEFFQAGHDERCLMLCQECQDEFERETTMSLEADMMNKADFERLETWVRQNKEVI